MADINFQGWFAAATARVNIFVEHFKKEDEELQQLREVIALALELMRSSVEQRPALVHEAESMIGEVFKDFPHAIGIRWMEIPDLTYSAKNLLGETLLRGKGKEIKISVYLAKSTVMVYATES